MNDQNKKMIIPVKGMHCKSCEMLIEDSLAELPDVNKVSVDHKSGQVEISYTGEKLKASEVGKKIKEAGYSVGQDEKALFASKDMSDYKDLGIAFFVLFGLYFIGKGLGLGSLSANISTDEATIPVILLVGLTAGVSTCMALVGGLVLGVSAKFASSRPQASAWQKFLPHLWFNAGRISAFALLGGILGMIGSLLQLSPYSLGIMTVIVGIVMLLMGLQLIQIFPWAEKIRFTMPKRISRFFRAGKLEGEYSHKTAFVTGALTFFLPCGFTQAMQLLAISYGTFSAGALIMGLFAIGTVPGLLGIGGLTSAVKGAFARRFFRFAGLAVILLAMLNINNGLNLSGFTLTALGQESEVLMVDPNVELVNGVQVVRMTEDSDGYSPNKFTVIKGVPVKWVIDAKQPYSCASALVVPKLNIGKKLTKGENIIEFTPNEIGRLNFSCSMGMYTGLFNVVDKNANGEELDSANQDTAPVAEHTCGQVDASGNIDSGCGCGGNHAACDGSCGK